MTDIESSEPTITNAERPKTLSARERLVKIATSIGSAVNMSVVELGKIHSMTNGKKEVPPKDDTTIE